MNYNNFINFCAVVNDTMSDNFNFIIVILTSTYLFVNIYTKNTPQARCIFVLALYLIKCRVVAIEVFGVHLVLGYA